LQLPPAALHRVPLLPDQHSRIPDINEVGAKLFARPQKCGFAEDLVVFTTGASVVDLGEHGVAEDDVAEFAWQAQEMTSRILDIEDLKFERGDVLLYLFEIAAGVVLQRFEGEIARELSIHRFVLFAVYMRSRLNILQMAFVNHVFISHFVAFIKVDGSSAVMQYTIMESIKVISEGHSVLRDLTSPESSFHGYAGDSDIFLSFQMIPSYRLEGKKVGSRKIGRSECCALHRHVSSQASSWIGSYPNPNDFQRRVSSRQACDCRASVICR
jgi:hypothetical protein